MPKRGFFIALEGTDGSGKTTQFKLLVRALRRAGRQVQTVDFPRYGQPSAYFVEQYLNGRYGTAREVGARRASLFYALDRFAVAPQIQRWLRQGRVVVANRYTWSNAAHQGGKMTDLRQRRRYWKWLFDLEFKLLSIPQPDLTLLIHMSAATAQRLVDKKGSREYLKGVKRDIHEADLRHLREAEAAYLELARRYKLFKIECTASGRLLTPAQIHRKVWQIVKTKS
ncbi:MAG: thymidylate kinase [Candidatus Kerfeldbacteria bacterium]|nr:thymidylate kinase [Candidatus Kerfeldbacteria bacterium]